MRTIRLLIATFAALFLVGGLGAGVAAAQDYPIQPPPDEQVLPDTLTPPGEVTPLAQQAPVRSSAGLPVTGGDVVGLTLIGAGLVGAGVVLVRTRRTAD